MSNPILAQVTKEDRVATPDEINILKRFAPFIDLILIATAAYRIYMYFVDFKPEKAFVEIIGPAFTIFVAFQWKWILGLFDLY